MPVVWGSTYIRLGNFDYIIKDNAATISKCIKEDISTVNIPNTINYNGINYNITSIGAYAFEKCSSLESVVIGNCVTSIGYKAFYDCDSLTSVVIPNSVTSIGSSAFAFCSSLQEITLPFVGASKTANNGYDQVFGYIFGLPL